MACHPEPLFRGREADLSSLPPSARRQLFAYSKGGITVSPLDQNLLNLEVAIKPSESIQHPPEWTLQGDNTSFKRNLIWLWEVLGCIRDRFMTKDRIWSDWVS